MQRRGPRLLPLILLLGLACAPQVVSDPTFDSRTYPPALDSNGELHLYVQPFPPEAGSLALGIAAIAAVGPAGSLEPLLESQVDLVGADLASAQKRLASAVLAPGLYRGLSIQIAAASVAGQQGTSDLLVPTEPVVLDYPFTVSRREASALFLSLDAETMADVTTSGLTPVFSVAQPARQLSSMLGFATVPYENRVSVFNKHGMEVVDVIATSSGPTGIAVDDRKGSVFVAAAGDHAIEIIDARTKQILGHIRLTAGDEPQELALSPDGRTLVSANYGSATASIMDTGARREVVKLHLPSRPTDVVADESRPRIYIVLARSNAISAIDLQRRQIVATVSLDESPVQGALGKDATTLYAITRNSPNLLVLDAETLALEARIYIGRGAISIEVDTRTGFIYVGRKSGEIGVIDPLALMPIDQFRVDGKPAFLAIDGEQSALFVLLSDSGLIQKLDLVSHRVLGTLEISRASYAAAIMGQR
jgi:DNA-binding beta-propeller fold protein YncE